MTVGRVGKATRALAAIISAGSMSFASPALPGAAADTVALSFSTVAQELSVGQESNVSFLISTGSQSVDGVQVEVSFPASLLEVVDADSDSQGTQITPGTSLPTVLQNEANNSSGKIMYAAGADL